MKYATKTTGETAKAMTTLRASHKAALKIARKINRKRFDDAKDFMMKLSEHDTSMDGKFHDKAAEGILELLKSLEANAKQKKLEPANMKLSISMHRGQTLRRGRRKRNFGMRLKSAHVQAVLLPASKNFAPKNEKAESSNPIAPKNVKAESYNGEKQPIARHTLGNGEKQPIAPRETDAESYKSGE